VRICDCHTDLLCGHLSGRIYELRI
jgi:hypothetical protein